MAVGVRMGETLSREGSEGISGIGELAHPGLSPEHVRVIDGAAEACRSTAREWVSAMTPPDRRGMVVAFYEAESLAAMALDDAIAQVGEAYRGALITQREDESRHVDVFSRWGGEIRPLPKPRVRLRDEHVWFTLLLINELTGYCQFMMLHALLESPGERREVEGICQDEQEHIGRLMQWMGPVMESRSARVCNAIVQRFRRGLDGRMSQFFPREDLAPLREAMRGHVGELLEAVFPGTTPEERD